MAKSCSAKTTGKEWSRAKGKAGIEAEFIAKKEIIISEEECTVIGEASSSEEAKTSGTSEAGGNTAHRVAIESKNAISQAESVVIVETIKGTNLIRTVKEIKSTEIV